MNGNHSPTATLEPLAAEQKEPKKKHKGKKKARLSKTPELKVLYHNSERESSSKLSNKEYEKELARLQVELVKMQYWAKHTGARIVILPEPLQLPPRKLAHDYVRPPRNEQFFVPQVY